MFGELVILPTAKRSFFPPFPIGETSLTNRPWISVTLPVSVGEGVAATC